MKPGADGGSDAGLLFCAYQADIAAQLVPMQRRLAAGDLLNQWTTPIGSAVFAVPPGLGRWVRRRRDVHVTLDAVGFRRRWGVLALLVPVLAALSVAAAPAARAHSSLISSSPAADSVLATPPTRIDLVFNEEIRDFQPKIAITVGDADPVGVTPVVDGATVSADLAGTPLPAPAAAGSVAWKVGYRVVSADGHPVSGLVPFSVGDGPAPTVDSSATGGTDATPTSPAGQTVPGWAWIGGAALAAAALVALLVLLRRRRPAGRADPAGGAGQ